jgi:hypothetical protein
MPQTVTIAGQVTLVDLMSVTLDQEFSVEAHDYIGPIALAGGGAEQQIEIGGDTQPVTLFWCKCTGADLTINVNDSSGGTPVATFVLKKDQPLILTADAVEDLLGAIPTDLYVTPDGVDDAEIYILVGRDATP